MASQDGQGEVQDLGAVGLSYYLLQYERVRAHEDRGIQTTSMVLAASMVAFGFVLKLAGTDGMSSVMIVVGVVVLNGFGIMTARNARRWVKIHQARARRVLHVLSPRVLELQETSDALHGIEPDSRNRSALILRSDRLLSGVHYVTMLVVVVGWVGSSSWHR